MGSFHKQHCHVEGPQPLQDKSHSLLRKAVGDLKTSKGISWSTLMTDWLRRFPNIGRSVVSEKIRWFPKNLHEFHSNDCSTFNALQLWNKRDFLTEVLPFVDLPPPNGPKTRLNAESKRSSLTNMSQQMLDKSLKPDKNYAQDTTQKPFKHGFF